MYDEGPAVGNSVLTMVLGSKDFYLGGGVLAVLDHAPPPPPPAGDFGQARNLPCGDVGFRYFVLLAYASVCSSCSNSTPSCSGKYLLIGLSTVLDKTT